MIQHDNSIALNTQLAVMKNKKNIMKQAHLQCANNGSADEAFVT